MGCLSATREAGTVRGGRMNEGAMPKRARREMLRGRRKGLCFPMGWCTEEKGEAPMPGCKHERVLLWIY